MPDKDKHESVTIAGMGFLTIKCPFPNYCSVRMPMIRWCPQPITAQRVPPQQGRWLAKFDEPRFSTKEFYHPNSDRPGTVAMKGTFLTDEDGRRRPLVRPLSLRDNGKSTMLHLRRDIDAAISAGPAERGHSVGMVRDAIINAVAQMLFIDVAGVDEARSVADHGVDILIAAVLRNCFVQALGTSISMLDILGY
ncbi:hypothetical protein BJX76DRAFT_362136 [Aspergillus varians]